MKNLKKTASLSMLLMMLATGSGSAVLATEMIVSEEPSNQEVIVNSDSETVTEDQGVVSEEPPVNFEEIQSSDEILQQIEDFYTRNDNPRLRAAAGTKWKAGTSVWDGKVGYWVTSYFWVKGSDMVSWNIVGNAQRKAVIAKYGSVNKNTSYKMKTVQHTTLSGKHSYKTVSASAVCYGK